MNVRMVARYVGMVLKLQTAFLLPPLVFSLVNGEHMAARGFVVTMLVCIVSFLLLSLLKYDKTKKIYIKDGFLAVAWCWLTLSVIGALPYWVSHEIPRFVDALFESVSGFTTTGASILVSVEGMSQGLLFWRAFTHWIGGMGVLVFLMAIVPAISGGERTLSVMKAESPGPAPGKLVPKLRQSSKILYIIYLALTLLEVVLLLAGGMPVFDSIVNAMATAGTGGFAIKNASIASYDSAYIHGVITVFMILFGINFNIFYFLLVRNVTAILKSEELRAYLGIIAAAIALITINITGSIYVSVTEAFHHASFQVASIISSTGFATTDYELWPSFSKGILIILMFIGASAGSTGGGLKVSRILILIREGNRILFRIGHPRSVEVVKLDGKTVDKTVIHASNAYFASFMTILGISFLIISLDNFDFETNFTAVLACLNNIGPGFGLVGPTGNYAGFSVLSKLTLTLNMLLGRLEIYPILLLLAPRSWKKI